MCAEFNSTVPWRGEAGPGDDRLIISARSRRPPSMLFDEVRCLVGLGGVGGTVSTSSTADISLVRGRVARLRGMPSPLYASHENGRFGAAAFPEHDLQGNKYTYKYL